MNLRSWGLSFRQAFRSLFSSGLMSVASVATVAISLLVLSVVVILAVNVEYAAGTLESQVEASVFLDEDVTLTPEEGQALVDQILQIEGVQSAVFIGKEQGLAEWRERLGKNNHVLEDLAYNPLPDSVRIEFADITLASRVAEEVAKLPHVDEVDYGQGVVENLMGFTRALRLGGAGLVILLVVATVMTISNTIRLAVFARRREVAIMKLVGATDWFIRRPFIIEGIFLGAIGAGLAMLCTATGYRYLVDGIVTRLPFMPIIPSEDVVPRLTLYLLGLGAALGAIGSSISLRRFLKV